MPVRAADGIGVIAFAQLGMEQVFLERPPGPGYRAFHVEDDLVQIDDPGRNQGPQRELARCRVTPGASNQPRALDIIAIELGQPVDRLALLFQRGVVVAIPFLVGFRIAQPEIR